MTEFPVFHPYQRCKIFFLLDIKVKPNASLKFQRDFAANSTTDIDNFEFRNEENASGNRNL